jgi:hypothetical protein
MIDIDFKRGHTSPPVLHAAARDTSPKRKRGRQTIASLTRRVSMGCFISGGAKYNSQVPPASAIAVKIPKILREDWIGYSTESTDALVPSNFRNRHWMPVVTIP